MLLIVLSIKSIGLILFISLGVNLVGIKFPDLNLTEFYENGYVNKSDRKEKFSYNNDVDVLLEMNTEEALNFLNKIFKEYQGKYQLESRY